MTYTKYEPADIEIYVKDKGLVLKEKSLVAFAQYNKKILGIGDEAEAIAAQNLESITIKCSSYQSEIDSSVLSQNTGRIQLSISSTPCAACSIYPSKLTQLIKSYSLSKELPYQKSP